MLEPIPDEQGRGKEDDREEDPIEHFRHFDAPWTGCIPSVYGLSASKVQTSQPGRKNSMFLVYPPEACINSAQFTHALTAIGWTYRTLTTRLGIPENHRKLWSAGLTQFLKRLRHGCKSWRSHTGTIQLRSRQSSI